MVLAHGRATGGASVCPGAEDFDRDFADLARNFRVISVDPLIFSVQRTDRQTQIPMAQKSGAKSKRFARP
jgi:hypothetical protein